MNKEEDAEKREREITRNTRKIKELLEKHTEEKKNEEIRNKEWKVRRKKLLEDGRVKQ